MRTGERQEVRDGGSDTASLQEERKFEGVRKNPGHAAGRRWEVAGRGGEGPLAGGRGKTVSRPR